MTVIHNLGFPRIGRKRELKFALESYWKGDSSERGLQDCAKGLRAENWQHQSRFDLLPVGDFSLYDHVLDTSLLLGNLPRRALHASSSPLDSYFRVARGRAPTDADHCCVHAGEMTKWFDTNYHYIVPELNQATEFQLNPEQFLAQIDEAQTLGHSVKPVILGPVTYLWLSKVKDAGRQLDFLDPLLVAYQQLLTLFAERNIQWVQIDEPILVTELDPTWLAALEKTYHLLKGCKVNLLLTTYFGKLQENLQFACNLPVAGLHIDAINGRSEVNKVVDWLPEHKVLSLGIINGRNIWKTDLSSTLDFIEPIAKKLAERLWLAPSCSLLHVPVDLALEEQLDPEVGQWLAFALQKLDELTILKTALDQGRESVKAELADNARAILSRKQSPRVHNAQVKQATQGISAQLGQRQQSYPQRATLQREYLRLPTFPTTTIGSFPQTQEIRKIRQQYKRGEIDQASYTGNMQQEISRSVREQEQLGIDVLVHGEAERNDMVEYFGEQLDGYVFSQFGWVQSYGSRCVKPPILFGDIQRPQAMTVEWSQYAQSLTAKPMKGMLTGPVTILNWSFVRDDQPRSETCLQLALAIRAEVLDLERAGIRIIQIDEAALREGLPLRKAEWTQYLAWAVEGFRICANGVSDTTQIHTHMCYSEFNDIIEAIAHMDADVITIETSRSDMELLDVFDHFNYPNEIGPGVYDIHSPNIPNTEQIVNLMKKAAERIPADRLWINPDCGLKTRQWHEVLPALKNMVAAAKILRCEHAL